MGKLKDNVAVPDDAVLRSLLGKTYTLWIEILSTIKSRYSPSVEEWKYYGAKSGWSMKLLYKKRNIFFFSPHENFFTIAFIFGDKAVGEILISTLPESLRNELEMARKYAEGRGIRIEVKKAADIPVILKLAEIKLSS